MSKSIKKRRLPYANTKIDPADTIASIKKLLKSYGIEDVVDATIKGESSIHFVYHAPDRDATFQIKPPLIYEKKRTWNTEKGRYEVLDVPMIAQTWRLVYWYLEKKLQAVSYGLVSIEREFLNQMLDNTGKITAGDYIMSKIEEDKGVLKLELMPEEESARTAVDATYEVRP